MAYKPDGGWSSPAAPVQQAPVPAFCTGCGLKLDRSHNFCPKCGLKIQPVEPNPLACECRQVFGPHDSFCCSCGKTRPTVAGPVAPRPEAGSRKPKAPQK